MQDYFHCIPLATNKLQRPAKNQGEVILDERVASSPCRRAGGMGDAVVAILGKTICYNTF